MIPHAAKGAPALIRSGIVAIAMASRRRAIGSRQIGIVTLPREERERTIRGADFHAAATTSRHVLIAAARKTRCD
jgi:hypothetical protein